MIVPNVAFDFVWHIVILATGLPKTSGTIYCYVRRKSDGYWLKADGTFTASTTAPTGADVPTATHTKGGLWKLTLSNTTTNSLSSGEVLHAIAQDSETDASSTVASDCVEEVVHLVPLAPTTSGRTLDVSSTGEAGVDWANVGSPASTVALSNTSAASIAGAVGSVAGAVGSVASGGISSASFVAGALTADALAADAAAEIADAVWDEATAGHVAAGSTGKAIVDIAAAGDPWETAVPGAYAAGTAGWLIGNYTDVAVSSRQESSSVILTGFASQTISAADTNGYVTVASISGFYKYASVNLTAGGLSNINCTILEIDIANKKLRLQIVGNTPRYTADNISAYNGGTITQPVQFIFKR
jgi:hypothetical protein